MFQMGFDLSFIQMRCQQPHAAIDIITNAARGNNPIRQFGGHHTANGKTIALMNIGHGQRIFNNAGQRSGVD